MKRFEYQITHHPADTFKKVVYFCTETAECTLGEVPKDQTATLAEILNERGQKGWELVQVFFGKDGVIAFWKRKVTQKEA